MFRLVKKLLRIRKRIVNKLVAENQIGHTKAMFAKSSSEQ